ncbi:MAG: TauD/TfdA family dioxygenase [Alphaproteobacteria bacterium]
MVRLTELSDYEREHLLVKQLPPLGDPVWVAPRKPLHGMRFALITTAGLHFRNEPAFAFADATYRAIPASEDSRTLVMSHSSVNFDRSGFQDDVNVVFPIDRFKELEQAGTIGSLASVHYSFMGAGLMPDVYEATVRPLARLLKADGVDAVFITPVCPNCTRATCAIAYYLEAEGIMTTGIALVRENAEALRPPRLLWVSFPIGLPLGRPGDPAFQHRVIHNALDLLRRPSGPVLEDHPEDLPEIPADRVPACPVNFARPETDESTWRARLSNELMMLKPWYEMSLRRRGRTTVGLSDTGIDAILERMSVWLDDRSKPLPDAKWLKFATEDAKAYYGEALSAQPGDYPPGHLQAIFWEETVLGAALVQYYEYLISDPKWVTLARIIAPRYAIGASTGNYAIGHDNEIIEQPAAKALREQKERDVQQRSTTMRIQPILGRFGADITGVDLATISDADFDTIYQAWLDHGVLRFHGQFLDAAGLETFSKRFGPLEEIPAPEEVKAKLPSRYVTAISNMIVNGRPIGGLGNAEANWHADMTYLETPPPASVLLGVKIPPEGGDTFFADQYAACEALPADLRGRVEGLTIKHDAAHTSIGQLRQGFAPVKDPREAPGAVHPIINPHPETGRKALYLGRREWAFIPGLELADSEALLDALWQYAVFDGNVIKQVWAPGDVVIWDNRCTLHRRSSFDNSHDRLMMRCQVLNRTHQ